MAAKKADGEIVESGPFAGRRGVLKVGVYRLIQQGKELVPERVALVTNGEVGEDEHEFCEKIGPGAYKLVPHGVRMTHVGNPIFVNVKDPRTGQVPKSGLIPGTNEAMAGFIGSTDTQNYVLHRMSEMEATLQMTLDRAESQTRMFMEGFAKLFEAMNDKVSSITTAATTVMQNVPAEVDRRNADLLTRLDTLSTARETALTTAHTALADSIRAETAAVRELTITVREQKGSADRMYTEFLQNELKRAQDELRELRGKHDTVKEEKLKAELHKSGDLTQKDLVELVPVMLNSLKEMKREKANGGAAAHTPTKDPPKLPEKADAGAGPAKSAEIAYFTLPEGFSLANGKREVRVPRPEVLEQKLREGRTFTADGSDAVQMLFFKWMRVKAALPVEYDAVIAYWESQHGALDATDAAVRQSILGQA